MSAISQRRVLYVFCSQHPSGAEFVFERLLLHNREAVQPFALCPPGEFEGRLRAAGITVVTTPGLLSLGRQQGNLSKGKLAVLLARRLLRAAAAIKKAIRRFDIEIVHANNVAAAAYCLLPMRKSRLTRRKTMWVWTTQDNKYLLPRDAKIAQLCCKSFDATIAVSQSVADEFPDSAARIRVVYSGLDPKEWRLDEPGRKSFRGLFNLDADTIAIGLIGVVSERKGHHVMLPAFELLTKLTARKVHLFLIGGTVPQYEEYQRHWQNETKRLGLEGKVTWTGPIAEMKGVYAGLDIIVNSTVSRYGEPLGTTIYEAMSCERVVLATRTGGSPEIIADGIDGFLCEPDNPAALAARLGEIIEKWNGLDELRGAARSKVLERFTVAGTARGTNALYEELLSGKSSVSDRL